MDHLNYGVIGNCTSAALVSQEGTIEWCCLPHFDSTAFFAKILDRNIGGEFSIRVAAGYKISQYYLHNTNILLTSFQRGKDQFEVIDLMEHYGFIEADDPRCVSTVIETHKQLGRNGLMYRFRNYDDFGAPKSHLRSAY